MPVSESNSNTDLEQDSVSQQDVDRMKTLLDNPDAEPIFRDELINIFKTGPADESEAAANTLAELAKQWPSVTGSNLELLCDLLDAASSQQERLLLARAIALSAPSATDDTLVSLRDRLQRQLKVPPRVVQGYLLEALTTIVYRSGVVHPPAVEVAGELLNTDSSITRYQALEHLAAAAEYGVDTVVPYVDDLVSAAEDGLADEREQALRALRWLTTEYPDELSESTLEAVVRKGLEATHPSIRREAAQMAGNLLVSGYLPDEMAAELTDLLADDDMSVRQAAGIATLIVSRHAPTVFDRPGPVANRLKELADEFDYKDRYNDEYHEAIENLRTQSGSDRP